MKLILRTHCTNDFFDGCSYALLDLTPALAGVILQRKAAFDALRENDPDLTEIRYHNCEAVYFSALPEAQSYLFDQVEEDIADKNFIQAPAGFEIGEEVIERTERDRMVVSRDGVWFECYPKHCDPLVDTREIDYKTVQDAEGEATLAR